MAPLLGIHRCHGEDGPLNEFPGQRFVTGTGYSSLSHLHRFLVDVLKIDRSFVQRLSGPSGDGGFVSAIIAISRTLSLTTVAEGIEEEEQLMALQEAGCTIGQGYYFSPPVAPEVIEEHLPAWAAGSAFVV